MDKHMHIAVLGPVEQLRRQLWYILEQSAKAEDEILAVYRPQKASPKRAQIFPTGYGL